MPGPHQPTPTAWETLRPLITQLYRKEDKTFKEVLTRINTPEFYARYGVAPCLFSHLR